MSSMRRQLRSGSIFPRLPHGMLHASAACVCMCSAAYHLTIAAVCSGKHLRQAGAAGQEAGSLVCHRPGDRGQP